MFKFILFSFPVILTLFSSPTLATNRIECLILESGSTIALDLRPSNNFNNCFRLENLTTEQPVTIYSFASKKNSHNLTVHDFNLSNATRIAQLQSDASGMLTYRSSVSSSSMGFKITPTNKLDEIKTVTISYLLIDEEILSSAEEEIPFLTEEVILFVEMKSIAN